MNKYIFVQIRNYFKKRGKKGEKNGGKEKKTIRKNKMTKSVIKKYPEALKNILKAHTLSDPKCLRMQLNNSSLKLAETLVDRENMEFFAPAAEKNPLKKSGFEQIFRKYLFKFEQISKRIFVQN